VRDRFVLEEGIIVLRRSFFNHASVALIVLRHPASCLVWSEAHWFSDLSPTHLLFRLTSSSESWTLTLP
jgi:hypothetical protein